MTFAPRMVSNARVLCWAVVLMGRTAEVEAQALAGCDSEDELLSNLQWLRRHAFPALVAQRPRARCNCKDLHK